MVSINNKINISKNYDAYAVVITDKRKRSIFINGTLAKLVLKPEGETPLYDTLNEKIGHIYFSPTKREFKMVITRYAGESKNFDSEIKGDNFGDRFGEWNINDVFEPLNEYILETIYYNLRKNLEEKIKNQSKEVNIDFNSDYYCPNCGKVNGKTRHDCFGVWVCAEKVKGDNYKWGCSRQIRRDEKYNFQNLELKKINLIVEDMKQELANLYRWELEWENQSKRSKDKCFRTNIYHVEKIKKFIKELTA